MSGQNSLGASTGSHLVQLTFNRISQLEQAIKQIAATKKQLNQNALEVSFRSYILCSRTLYVISKVFLYLNFLIWF